MNATLNAHRNPDKIFGTHNRMLDTNRRPMYSNCYLEKIIFIHMILEFFDINLSIICCRL